MGRLRQPLSSPLLAVRYRKLVDEYGTNKDFLTFLPSNIHDYLQSSCSHCGHVQKIKAEELNTIVGNAFRMAYAAQLQKRSTAHAFNDVIRNNDQDPRYWAKHKLHGKESVLEKRAMNALSRKSLDHTNGNTSPLTINMNVPSKPQSLSLGEPPSSSVNPDTPCSEESNSPTELNSCRRLRDKPPLIKRLPMGCAEEERCPLVNTGYINDGENKIQRDQLLRENCDNRLHVPTTSEEDTNRKRISQSSSTTTNSSSGSSGTTLTHLPLEGSGRDDNDSEEIDLKSAAWFQAGIPREIALEVLKEEPIGSFLVRGSASKPGCFALSLRVPQDFQPAGIAHYLIMRTHRGYKIKGFTKEFSSLTALITHHSVMPELLPCPLSLARYNPTFTRNDNSREFADIHGDPDYSTLTDFARLMADLNV